MTTQFLESITISSNVLAGVPFIQDLFVWAYAGTPGGDGQSGSVRFLGFTDLAGNPVPFLDPPTATDTPEPATWLLLVCGLSAIALAARYTGNLLILRLEGHHE